MSKIVKEAAAAPAEPAVPDKSTYEYVTIPDVDMFGVPHHSIWLNMDEYKPGTHLVSPTIAGELRRILKAFNDGQIRLIRPTADPRATATLNKGY